MSDLESILRAALAAGDPARLVAGTLADEPRFQRWAGTLAAAPPPRAGESRGTAVDRPRLALLAAGRSALGMARGAIQLLGDLVDVGWVFTPAGVEDRPRWLPPQVAFCPRADSSSDRPGAPAGRRVAEPAAELAELTQLVDDLDARDHLLVLLSAGASTLLALPVPALGVETVSEVRKLLREGGLGPRDRYRILGALDQFQHGGLARRAAPAETLGLVLADRPGPEVDDADAGLLTIHSERGRTLEVLLRREGLWNALPPAVRDFISPYEPSTDAEARVEFRSVGRGAGALEGAAGEARRLGYHVRILSRQLEGSARKAGAGLARAAVAVRDGLVSVNRPACLLAMGEFDDGSMGSPADRSGFQAALGAALRLDGEEGVQVATLDARGGAGPAAPAIRVDGYTARRARSLDVDPERALLGEGAYPLLERLGALVPVRSRGTGPNRLLMALVTD